MIIIDLVHDYGGEKTASLMNDPYTCSWLLHVQSHNCPQSSLQIWTYATRRATKWTCQLASYCVHKELFINSPSLRKVFPLTDTPLVLTLLIDRDGIYKAIISHECHIMGLTAKYGISINHLTWSKGRMNHIWLLDISFKVHIALPLSWRHY